MSKVAIDIDYVARLARIELTEKERELFSSQLGSILEYFEKLDGVGRQRCGTHGTCIPGGKCVEGG